ncbi:hypothetical protein V1512DRAFT_255495 [Lipomyces arxii]|uniref:uncharacterized protein n=1 Tax=Lipomyces arxii TaxID=56418 RepID=UPI0034CDB4B8
MTPPNRVQTGEKEGIIALSVFAYRSDQFKSMSTATKAFKVPKTTLFHRIKGRPSREGYVPNNKKLIKIEEDVLIRDILQLESHSLSSSFFLVRDVTDSVSGARGEIKAVMKAM